MRSGKASLGGVAGGGSGGAVSVSRAEVDVAAKVGVSARRRFKKPHGCDCESRMFMDTNVGCGFDGLDSLLVSDPALSTVAVAKGCQPSQVFLEGVASYGQSVVAST